MSEDRFDQNFIWYEWSFVSPGDVPDDDLSVTTNRFDAAKSAIGVAPSGHRDHPIRDNDWRWTT